MMTRWEALVSFDDEIRDAAAKLIPFGSVWVDKMGEAFFALNEDRTYLPNIVARLTEEAEFVARYLAHEAERAAAQQWLDTISPTADGKPISEGALAILVELRARGYAISKDATDQAIRITRNSATSFLRSDGDIMRLGSILLQRPRSG